ncbi:Six-hairpin glycosidase-like protein [Tuber borchii]|uniref:Six-hairpin glycosidase-like protein n=1 Tax=Tuber borchii TaxID=42251 RepID=A0A2T6ZZR9_TUBBO|nr:Six-hairpin glycosidase-like protein [Tuber borchii]
MASKSIAKPVALPTPISASSGSKASPSVAVGKGGGAGSGCAEDEASEGASGAKDKLELKPHQLLRSQSPYVRGHAHNLVRWQLWNEETLELAKKNNRIVFVSIGYAACHCEYANVMERESFENEEIARVLNENFIPIKIDREERSDIDRIYMNFVQATTGSGGWPLNVFLTPDLQPVFGGTYWPGPSAVGGMKDQLGFLEVLGKIANVWKEQHERCVASASDILNQLKEFADEGLKGTGGEPGDGLELDLLEEAYQHFMARYDPLYGGFGNAPKFPTPVNLAFLLRLGTFPATVQDIVGEMECENAKSMVVATLQSMAKGGIHDHIGHGFSRYSVTANWSLPHFEKMLYDQAQLLSIYIDAWLVTKSPEMLEAANDIAEYMCLDALKSPDGGFYSSEDADSLYRKADTEKREGAFYVWTRKEFDVILGEQEASICARYWNVHRDGNVDPVNDPHDEFIAQNVLSIASTPERLSKMYGMSAERITNIISSARQKLLQHRLKERPRPNLDDKIITTQLYKKNAEEAISFIRKNLYDEKTGILKRVYREGPGETDGFADDYAFLISGLLCMYEATFDVEYLQWADALQQKQIDIFWDAENGGFFSTSEGASDLILRLKDGLDSQEPSTNGVSANNLFRLGTLLGDSKLEEYAQQTCSAFSTELLQHPFLFSSLMPAIVASNLGMRSVVLAGDPKDPTIEKHLKRLRSKLLTNTTLVQLDPARRDSLEWLLNRNDLHKELLKVATKDDGKPVVQVCEGTKCLDAFYMGDIESVLEELG